MIRIISFATAVLLVLFNVAAADAHHVVALAREQHEADQTPQCVDQGDDLGGQSAP